MVALDALFDMQKTAKKATLERVKNVFRYALNFKFLAIIGEDLFDTIWSAPGSSFDPRIMSEKFPKNTSRSDITISEPLQKVALTLVPGIYIHRFARKVVDYCAFSAGGEEDLGGAKLLASSIVVLSRKDSRLVS